MTKNIRRSILSKLLPDRTKRLVLISALVGTLKEKDEVDERYLQILNERLELSNKSDALKLPIKMGKSIWSGDEVSSVISSVKSVNDEADIRRLAGQLFRRSPLFLRYNNESAIVDDLATLLRLEVSVGFKF